MSTKRIARSEENSSEGKSLNGRKEASFFVFICVVSHIEQVGARLSWQKFAVEATSTKWLSAHEPLRAEAEANGQS